MNELSASGLADLAGVTEIEVARMVELGILVVRDGPDPFLETDVQKVRLAVACEQAGLPMEGIAAAIRAGRLSFAFLEASPFRRWAATSCRWGTRRYWASTAASKSWRGPSISSSASRTSSRRLACWDGQSGSRRCRSWTWWATPT